MHSDVHDLGSVLTNGVQSAHCHEVAVELTYLETTTGQDFRVGQ